MFWRKLITTAAVVNYRVSTKKERGKSFAVVCRMTTSASARLVLGSSVYSALEWGNTPSLLDRHVTGGCALLLCSDSKPIILKV